MRIENELLEEAKEKLGDENAAIMAELLQLEHYDEKNMKSLCPYHDEDTPSFVYDKKNHRFHCFGCGATVDIIDVLMEKKGLTFLGAAEEVFDRVGMPYSFGERNVQTRRNYKYPHEEPNGSKDLVLSYLNRRGISKNVADYLDIRQDSSGNCVFNYYDTNDVLTLVKYRPSHSIDKKSGYSKTWCQKDADTSPLLYNMNRINTSKPLVISEGECYLGDTEVFTPKGWIRFDKYKGQDVLQVDENLHGSFVKPTSIVKKMYFGDIYTYKYGGYFSLTTTCNHKWVYIDSFNHVNKNKISQFPKNLEGCDIPTTITVDGEGLPISDQWIALQVVIVADGLVSSRTSEDFNYCRFALKSQRKITRLQKLLTDSGTMFAVSNPPSKEGRTYITFRVPKWVSKEFSYDWIIATSLKQKKTILSEIVNWDGGYGVTKNELRYVTKSHHNAEWVQTLAHCCGYMSKILLRKNDTDEKTYEVYIYFEKNHVPYNTRNLSITQYEGKVYCVTVPTGMILVRNNGRITVCGNCDCASLIESGCLNSVSVPFGAGNTHWIEENWDWLESFKEIIIWADNDEAGEKMRKEAIYRLGTWRTKYVITPPYYEKENGKRIPIKDINECLQVGGKEFVRKLLSEAKDTPVKSVVDYSEVEELDISQIDGVRTGIKPIDRELSKVFYGTLTILSGRPGSGKTSILDQTIAHSIDEGKPVFLFSKEMPERISVNWFNTIIAGRRHMEERTNRDGETYCAIPKDIQKKMQSYYKRQLFIYRDDEPNDVDSVMKSAEECVRKYGCKLVVLDNLMMIDLHCAETEKNTAQTEFINTLIKFAAKFNVAVLLCAHPRKTQDSNSDIEMYDIAGTSNIINLAMRSIGMRRVSKKEKEDPKSKWGKYDVVLTIMKDRLFGKTDTQIGLWYDLMSRRFYTDYDEYDAKFDWDEEVYTNKIPYVDRLAVDPADVFPDK